MASIKKKIKRGSGQHDMGWGWGAHEPLSPWSGCRIQAGSSGLKDAFYLPPLGKNRAWSGPLDRGTSERSRNRVTSPVGLGELGFLKLVSLKLLTPTFRSPLARASRTLGRFGRSATSSCRRRVRMIRSGAATCS